MATTSHLSEFSGLNTTTVTIDTTNITLARFSKLGILELEKLLSVYGTSLESALLARSFANSVAIHALAITFIFGFIAHQSSRESIKKVATFITVASTLTAFLAGFTSLVYTFQIQDYNYWKNVCVKFIELTPQST